MLLSAIVALDVARTIRLLQEQAEHAECASAARHVLWQVVLQVVLHLAIRARAADGPVTDLHILLLVSSILFYSHLCCVAWRLKQALW